MDSLYVSKFIYNLFLALPLSSLVKKVIVSILIYIDLN